MYVRWRSHSRKKHPQIPTLCAYLYQTVRIDGKPKARVLAYLGSIRDVNHPLEQQQFWQSVEAKVSERQWQAGEKEKILQAIALRVPRPMTESEKLLAAIERQMAAGVTASELVERLEQHREQPLDPGVVTRLDAEVAALRREVAQLKQSLAAYPLTASRKASKPPEMQKERVKELWRVKDRLQHLGMVADGHQIEAISQLALAAYLGKYQTYPPTQFNKEQGRYDDTYPIADLEMLDRAIRKVLGINPE